MGQLFALLLVQSPRGRLVALAETDRSRHAELRAAFGAPVYDDCETLLAATTLDAVVVATSDQAISILRSRCCGVGWRGSSRNRWH
jgi:predicted dehydrogenase